MTDMSSSATSRILCQRLGPACRVSRFRPEAGAEEVHLFIEPETEGAFEAQLEQVDAVYSDALRTLGLPRHTAVFRRLFISDAANQLERIMASPLGLGVPQAEAAAVSCIEQPPMCLRKIALMAYHVGDAGAENKTLVPVPGGGPYARTLLLRRGEETHLWTSQMTGEPWEKGLDSESQTRRLFEVYCDLLQRCGADLLHNSVRTWVFVKDIDRHYAGMVNARREIFVEKGLDRDSHYIVSTGIEGRTEEPTGLVCLDAVALAGMQEGQLVFVDRLDHLNRTDDYGVTFERAARLDHADRSHLYLAGTASIDSRGRILHRGKILQQVDRTLENISALLEAGGATLEDLAATIVYLRDAADADQVTAYLDETRPHLPFTTVLAPVCRPGWLVEIEGLAIFPNEDTRWPQF